MVIHGYSWFYIRIIIDCRQYVILQSSNCQELEAVNAKIAQAAVTGQLDRNPVMQGLLIQCVNKLEKETRGITSNRGRHPKSCTTKEQELLSDAALSLAIAGGSRQLCIELNQKLTRVRVKMEQLHSFGLPDPSLSLMFQPQLEKNFTLIDQQAPRDETTKARRFILAFDGTYLMKTFAQCPINGEVGLVGGCWSPQDESKAFLDLGHGTKDVEKAAVMMEFLMWDPCALKKRTFSAAAMPMSLAAPKSDESENQTKAGNWEP